MHRVHHSRAHRDGFFTIFDVASLREGKREEIWHGHFGKRLSSERLADFEDRREEIVSAAEEQIKGFRIFVGPLPKDRRLLARVESGVMDVLYSAPSPFSDVPDRGMSLSRRWDSEEAIRISNRCEHKLHAFPDQLVV